MTGGAGHLGDRVSAYVDRTLAPDLLRRLDRHVVTCERCRAAADGERRLLASLRASRTPPVPTSLTAALRGLSSSAPVLAPSVGLPIGSPSVVLPTVPPRAPALHRSPVRAVLLAGLAAGASAAAAWGIAATGSAAGTGGPALLPGTPPAARLGGQLGSGQYTFPASARFGSDEPFGPSWELPAAARSPGAGGSAPPTGGFPTGMPGASSRVQLVALPLTAHPRLRGRGAGRQLPHD